jgi:hypothetical protein
MKKPGTPNSNAWLALASFRPSRANGSVAINGAGSAELTRFQNSRSFPTRAAAALPAISAALIAPIEIPATQVGSR